MDGRTYSMCSLPLEPFFTSTGCRPEFEVEHTACWRGYVGRWEIVDDRLYLVSIEGRLSNGEPATVESLFPGSGNRILAHWLSDEVRLTDGERLKYSHTGYESVYERDIFLTFKEGGLVGRRVRDNRAAPPPSRSFDPVPDHDSNG